MLIGNGAEQSYGFFHVHDISDISGAKQILLFARGAKIKYNKFSGKADKLKEVYERFFDDNRKISG